MRHPEREEPKSITMDKPKGGKEEKAEYRGLVQTGLGYSQPQTASLKEETAILMGCSESVIIKVLASRTLRYIRTMFNNRDHEDCDRNLLEAITDTEDMMKKIREESKSKNLTEYICKLEGKLVRENAITSCTVLFRYSAGSS